jgi:hypothetical protein
MDSFNETVKVWTAVVGTAVTVIGLAESRFWLTLIGLAVTVAVVSLLFYAKKQRRRLKSAEVIVEDLSIDSLNVANLRRRMNRSLVIQEAVHLAEIDGTDLTITWRYSGYCRGKRESVIEFSIDADNNIPFDRLECFAYDLQHDPRRAHRVRPLRVGPDGISKKLAVPLLQPLRQRDPFSVMLTCKLPGCMTGGTEYHTSTVSFDQPQIPRFSVHLRFRDRQPEWLRVYQCGLSGKPELIKTLRSARKAGNVTEYRDDAENVPAQSARIYVFRRADALQQAA